MKRTKIKEMLGMEPGCEVLAKGWVRTKRGNRQVKFIALNDGSTINNIQVVANAELFDEELFKRITTGASLAVKGELVASIGSGQAVEIQAKEHVFNLLKAFYYAPIIVSTKQIQSRPAHAIIAPTVSRIAAMFLALLAFLFFSLRISLIMSSLIFFSPFH